MSRRLQFSLLASAVPVALLFFARIGFREDIVSALRTVRFLFKFVVVVPLAVFAIGAMFQRTSLASTLDGGTTALESCPSPRSRRIGRARRCTELTMDDKDDRIKFS